MRELTPAAPQAVTVAAEQPVAVRRRSRATSRLLLAAGLAMGLVLGGGVAWAFWNATGRAVAPAALRSGTFDLVVSQGGVESAVGAGTGFTLTGLQPATGYFPGTSASTMLRVTNRSTSSAPLTVTGATFSFAAVTGLTFAGTFAWGGTSDGTTCTGGTSTIPTTVLQPGQGLDVCAQVTLTAGDTSAQSAQTTATVAFTSKQVQR